MSGNIFRHDCYDIRKFKDGDFGYFVDIGANIGTVSLMAKILFPRIQLVSIEPCPETFKRLYQYLRYWIKRKERGIYNIALGNGSPMSIHLRHGENGGDNRCYSDQEKELWKEGGPMVPSKTLSQIFRDYNVDVQKKYVLKIDCEGGERFLLQKDVMEESLQLVRGSVQTMMELHFGIGGNRDQWNLWLDQLRDTHTIKSGGWENRKTENQRYVFKVCNKIEQERGRPAIELISKQWEQKHG
jgi:FkbM family methyltransferase